MRRIENFAERCYGVIFVYALVDPRDGSVRYVGITDKPRTRWKAHINCAKLKPQTALRAWISELIALHFDPIMKVLAEVRTSNGQSRLVAKAVERDFIRRYLKRGYPLTNIDRVIVPKW